MPQKITARKVKYDSNHSPDLKSTRVIPESPYTQQDIHNAFDSIVTALCELGDELDQRYLLDKQQFLQLDFKWLPPVKNRKRFVPKNRPHRLKHQNQQVYTVKDLIEMIDSKVNHTQKHNRRLLEDFTESMLMRTNLSLKWFEALVRHYYKGDLKQQQLWQHRLRQIKIKIDWV